VQGIYALQKFSTLDFPDKLSAIIWFSGCNMRCLYCYNKDVVFGKARYQEGEILNFLKSRVGLLDGVVITGGCATLYGNLVEFISKIKALGFAVKLDTNGLNFKVLKELIDKKLLDYVALDFKAPKSKFYEITKSKDFESFEKSLLLLINSNIEFEVRTTVHTDLLNEDDINQIIDILKAKKYQGIYYIQNFFNSPKETIGNLKAQKRVLNLDKIDKKIRVEFRNF